MNNKFFTYSDIEFKIKKHNEKSLFFHNLGIDYTCIAVWKSARPYIEYIREEINKQFDIYLETQIVWSKQHFENNARRLYEMPILSGFDSNTTSFHSNKIGDIEFTLFVIKDPNPIYSHRISVSKNVEFSNVNITDFKYRIRNFVEERTGDKYSIHSSNNILEFYYQSYLLLGEELFEKLLNGEKLNIPYLNKDLEGADGWDSWEQVFRTLKYCTNYLILRGFESLPFNNPEKDLDLLTDNFQRLASSLGVIQNPNKNYKGFINVNKEKISLDIRFIGDNYYDTKWAKDMLITKVKHNGIFVPRIDNYFFSLLYHCKVHKNIVDNKYHSVFENLIYELDYNWFNLSDLNNDQKCIEIINGFFKPMNYYFVKPIDTGVFINKKITKHLVTQSLSKKNIIKIYWLKFLRRIIILMPSSLKSILKKLFK